MFAGFAGFAHVHQHDAQSKVGHGQLGIKPQRLSERRHGIGEPALLRQRVAQALVAPGVLRFHPNGAGELFFGLFQFPEFEEAVIGFQQRQRDGGLLHRRRAGRNSPCDVHIRCDCPGRPGRSRNEQDLAFHVNPIVSAELVAQKGEPLHDQMLVKHRPEPKLLDPIIDIHRHGSALAGGIDFMHQPIVRDDPRFILAGFQQGGRGFPCGRIPGSRGDLEGHDQPPTIASGGVVSHTPRVKSGTSTGRLPLATDQSLKGPIALQAAAS